MSKNETVLLYEWFQSNTKDGGAESDFMHQ